MKDYSLTGTSRAEMIYNKEKLLALGGVHGGIQKWKHKLEEAKDRAWSHEIMSNHPKNESVK